MADPDEKGGEHGRKDYQLIVNKKDKKWPKEEITGAEIKGLADAPNDWVVNQIIPGPGNDPQVEDAQSVHLSPEAEPKGIKRFTVRKPTTSPGQ